MEAPTSQPRSIECPAAHRSGPTHETHAECVTTTLRNSPGAFAPAVVVGALLFIAGTLSASQPLPFNQAAVKQSTAPADLGPSASTPYFNVRFALPVPPDNDRQRNGHLVGIDAAVADHHHSPGFEVMPNGDVLIVPFSGPSGREGGPDLRIVQARLRHGAEEFDLPEEVTVQGVRMSDLLQPDGRRQRHGPPLMWREGNTVWLFTDVSPHPTEDGSGSWGLEPFKVLFRVFKSMERCDVDDGRSQTEVLRP